MCCVCRCTCIFRLLLNLVFYKQKRMDKLWLLQEPTTLNVCMSTVPRCWGHCSGCDNNERIKVLQFSHSSGIHRLVTRLHGMYRWIYLRLHWAGFSLNSICALWRACVCVRVIYVCVIYVCTCASLWFMCVGMPPGLNDNWVEVSEAHNDIQRYGGAQVISIQTQVPEATEQVLNMPI